jgi:hypothetical protein
MSHAVLEHVREDLRIRSLDPPVRLSAHTRAIWLSYGPLDSLVDFHVERAEWWLPLKKSRARALAAELVEGLLGKVNLNPIALRALVIAPDANLDDRGLLRTR